VKSGNVQQIQQAYPGLTEGQRKKWEDLFRAAKPEDAAISRVRGVSGPDASGLTVVNFVMDLRFSDRTSGTPVAMRPSHYQARLKREGSKLVLVSLTDITAQR
jgi:hypothetical protein